MDATSANKKRLGPEIRASADDNPTKYGDSPPQPKMHKVSIKEITLEGFRNRRDKRSPVFNSVAKDFDAAKLGVPVVWKKADGDFYAFEGRKMIAGIAERNKARPGFMTHIWCEVITEKEAEARKRAKTLAESGRDNRKTRLEKFKEQYEANDESAVDIVNTLSYRGICIDCVATPKETDIKAKCLSAIMWAFDRGILETTLDAVEGAWGIDKKALQVKVLMPLAVLINKNRHVEIKKLSAALSETTPEGIDAQAGTTNGFVRTIKIANFVAGLYNERAADAQRLDEVGRSDL